MKKVKFLFIVMVALVKFASAQSTDAILGTWLNQEKDAKVFIYKADGKYFGKIVWLKVPNQADGKTPRTDINNSSPSLKNRPLQNLIILSKFMYDDEQWTGGDVYDPKGGKTYSATMKLKGGKLEIRGYVGIAAFGKTTAWTKAD